VLDSQLPAQALPQAAEQALAVQGLRGDQVLPEHRARLGRSRAAGLQTGLQHAEPAHPPQEPELPALGL